jgi:hypothetical protein
MALDWFVLPLDVNGLVAPVKKQSRRFSPVGDLLIKG